ncbi:hypothetical protein DQG23_29180 [Paenibacillus contaminans]|uniref:Alpha-galactosidase n=2 Tax=Paenibacillus contaminans TaxID=450362 RepID=A0A329M8I1_9BACL|nr:hypothetical protein DQG23_29180 [Paenibacillus contaminans]
MEMNRSAAMDMKENDGRLHIRCVGGEVAAQFIFGFRIELEGGVSFTERDFEQVGDSGIVTRGESAGGTSGTVRYRNDLLEVTVELELDERERAAVWSIGIVNLGAEPVVLERVSMAEGELRHFSNEKAYRPWMALNVGLQSTDMHAGIETIQPNRTSYFDSFTLLHQADWQWEILLGCISFASYFSHVLVTQRAEAVFDVTVAASLDRLKLMPGASAATEKAVLLFGTDGHDRLLEAYMDKVCRQMEPRSSFTKPPTGWLSWYYYYGTVTEQDMMDNATALREQFPELPVDYIVVDSGWFLETGFGDWEPNGKFHYDMKRLADRITEAGFKPGLWFSPLLADSGSKLLRDHPDWVLRNNGMPVAGMNPNGSDVLELHEKNNVKYVLDLTNPDVLDYLRVLFRKVTREWGYRYIKLDFLVRALFTDRGNHSSLGRDQVYFPGMSTAAAYRNTMQVIREAAGDDCFILGCAAPLFASAGNLIDANRMTPDITRRNYTANPVRPSAWELVKLCGRTMAARYFLHGKIGFNDPDVLVVRGHEPEGISDDYKPTPDEAKVWAGVVALSGGMLFYNDKLSELEEDRKPILRQLYPIGPAAAVPLDFFNPDVPERWKLAVRRGDEQWTVLGVFNWGEECRDMTIDLESLGFAAEESVHGLEFWSRSYVSGCGRLTLPAVRPRSMQLLALHARTYRPQLLGTDMHFTQGWAEFASAGWADHTMNVVWRPDYVQRGIVVVHVPEAYAYERIETNADHWEKRGQLLLLRQRHGAEELKIRFVPL